MNRGLPRLWFFGMQIQNIFSHLSMPMNLSFCLLKLGTFSGPQPKLTEELATCCPGVPHSASSQDSSDSGRSSATISLQDFRLVSLHVPQFLHL